MSHGTSPEHSAAHRPLRADDARGRARAAGAGDRRCVFEAFARRLPEGRRYGVVAGTGRLLEALEQFRFGDDEIERPAPTQRSSTRRPATGWPATASPATSAGMPRASATSPARRCSSSSRPSPRASSSRRWSLSILNHDTAIASAASRMTPPPATGPASRWAPGARTRRRPSRPPAPPTSPGSRRRATSRRAAATASHGRHRRARLHPRCTTPSGRPSTAQVDSLGKGTTLLVDTYDVPDGGRTRRRGRRARAGRGPARLGRPARARPREVRAQLDALGAHRHPDHRHVRPRRVRHRRRSRPRPVDALRRRHRAGDRLRRPDGEHGLQARRALRRRRGDAAGRRRGARTRPRSVAASGRCAGSAPTGWRRPRSSASRSAPRTTATTAPLMVDLVRAGEVVGPAGPRPPPGNDTWPRAPSCRPAPCGCSAARSPSRRSSRTGTAAET